MASAALAERGRTHQEQETLLQIRPAWRTDTQSDLLKAKQQPSRQQAALPFETLVTLYQRPRQESYPTTNIPLQAYLDRFDTAWQAEGLPQDWYNLHKRVGFSMDSQMNLLQGTDYDSRKKWAEQTKQDLLGFCLEYLSDVLVYPAKYVQQPDGRLVDPRYGKDIVEMTTEQERGGTVKKAMHQIQSFMRGPGTLAVLPSPMGESGLTTDDGAVIIYPDSYFMIFEKTQERGQTIVTNYTVQTDFSHAECREVIRVLTGRELPATAGMQEYVKALTGTEIGSTVRSAADVVKVLEEVRSNHPKKAGKIFDTQSFASAYQDLARGEELYHFNTQTQELIKDFEGYVLQSFYANPLDLQKALAATILRLSKYFLVDKKHEPGGYATATNTVYRRNATYGDVLQQVSEIPGCAGGGGSMRAIADAFSGRIGFAVSNATFSSSPYAQTEKNGVYVFRPSNKPCVGCGDKDSLLGPCQLCVRCDVFARYTETMKRVK